MYVSWLLLAAHEAQSQSPEVPAQSLPFPGKKINHQEDKL